MHNDRTIVSFYEKKGGGRTRVRQATSDERFHCVVGQIMAFEHTVMTMCVSGKIYNIQHAINIDGEITTYVDVEIEDGNDGRGM